MKVALGCIADDFTGATDLAGILARAGYPVSLRVGVPEDGAKATAPFEVIALKSRTAPVGEAVAESRAALAWLRKAGAKRIFFKYCSTFDSTAHGNIGPVAEALMSDLNATQTIYCPAFPENGRSVYMGNLFVGQVPLAESPMKDHPLTPMRDSNLMRLLGPQVGGDVGLIDRLTVAQGAASIRSALQDSSAAHLVVDAVADDDLSAIAAACQDMALMTGGSALAAPLPALYAKAGHIAAKADTPRPPKLARGAVILSGSCSAMTNAQVSTYQKSSAPTYRIDPLTLAESGVAPVVDWLESQNLDTAPLVYATAAPTEVGDVQARLGVAEAGAMIEAALAACAVAARDKGVGRIVVAGGETSGAVTQALDVTQLTIGREIAPGVPWTYCTSDGHLMALTLKSGNFGGPDFFEEALAILDGS